MSERLSITPLGPYIGAQISGADLTRPLSDNQFEQLYHAVLRHQVVFLRDQTITPQQQRALAQRFAPGTPFWHRLVIGYDVTDELFGITIARPGSLNPYYTYGAILLAAPAWAIGTALGIIAGNLLPLRAVSALSVALYGMFLAIIIPPARKSRVVAALVAISFALSFVCNYLPGISTLSEGTRTILLTVLISSAAAALFPVNPEEQEAEHDA